MVRFHFVPEASDHRLAVPFSGTEEGAITEAAGLIEPLHKSKLKDLACEVWEPQPLQLLATVTMENGSVAVEFA